MMMSESRKEEKLRCDVYLLIAKPKGGKRMFERSTKLLALLTVIIAMAGCGGGSGSSTATVTQNGVDPGSGTGDVTVTGKVAGTAFVAVDAASAKVVARHVAAVQSDGSKAFSIKIQSGKQYKFYLVENEGTSDERVFPLYIGNGNKMNVSAGTCNLGFITTTGDGIATPATTPSQFTGAVEDKTVPAGVAANQSSVYTQSDLTGTWYLFQYHAGAKPYYSRATLPLDVNGAGTANNFVNSDGHISTNASTSLSMKPSGVAIDTLNTRSNTRLIMSGDKSLMVGVGNNGLGDVPSMSIAVKGGGSFQQSDLAGNWKLHYLVASSTFREWQRSDVTINNNGTATTSNTQYPATPSTSGKSFTLLVNSNGVITAPTDYVYGAMTQDKNLVVCTFSNNDGTTGLGLFVRKGGSGFSNSDLTGSWRSNWLAIGATSDMWVRSLAVIGSNGTISSYGVIANGLSEPDNTNSVPITVNSSGIIVRPEIKFEGIVAVNKKMIIYTGLKGNNLNQFQLGILMK